MTDDRRTLYIVCVALLPKEDAEDQLAEFGLVRETIYFTSLVACEFRPTLDTIFPGRIQAVVASARDGPS
jgi:hypothetical protein